MSSKQDQQSEGTFGASFRATLDAAASRAAVIRASEVPARARAASNLIAGYVSKTIAALTGQQSAIAKGQQAKPEAIIFYTRGLLLTEAETSELAGLRRLTTFCENSDINLSLRFKAISGNPNNVALTIAIDPSKPFEKNVQGELKF